MMLRVELWEPKQKKTEVKGLVHDYCLKEPVVLSTVGLSCVVVNINMLGASWTSAPLYFSL